MIPAVFPTIRNVLCLFVLFVLVCFQSLANAETYSARPDESQWYVTTSIFECTLIHDIPIYGQAIFLHEAGEGLKFYTTVNRNLMKPGGAALVIEPSHWRPGETIDDLGYVTVRDTRKPLWVETQNANSMMQGLMRGATPAFTRKARYSKDSLRVLVSPVNFMAIYNDYQSCVASLLSVNFRQVERTRVHFTVDKWDLTEADKVKLERVLLYVNADPTVTEIYIDGHTDSSGRRVYNRRLSKRRAEAVTDYLVDQGLPADMITTRYHGERYPVENNRSKQSKAENRRTTIRLVRPGIETKHPSE